MTQASRQLTKGVIHQAKTPTVLDDITYSHCNPSYALLSMEAVTPEGFPLPAMFCQLSNDQFASRYARLEIERSSPGMPSMR